MSEFVIRHHIHTKKLVSNFPFVVVFTTKINFAYQCVFCQIKIFQIYQVYLCGVVLWAVSTNKRRSSDQPESPQTVHTQLGFSQMEYHVVWITMSAILAGLISNWQFRHKPISYSVCIKLRGVRSEICGRLLKLPSSKVIGGTLCMRWKFQLI